MRKLMPIYICVLAIFSLFFSAFLFALSIDFCCTTSRPCAASEQVISMRFCYNDMVFTYNTAHLDNIDNFYLRSIAQKNGRLGTSAERADLLERIIKLGFSPEDACQYVFKGLEKVIADMQQKIDCEPVDAELTFKPNVAPYFFFKHEKIGYKLNIATLVNEIISSLRTSSNSFTINLAPKKLEPTVFYDDLKKYANLRSSFFTSFNGSNANRKHNIALAIGKFNGLVLDIGKEYSFNQTTGRRTEANGYCPANIIVDKKYVEGYGGGVCQASTTLYNALLLSGNDIREVHSHSLASSYVNLGFDAMVNYGTSDLRWINNTSTKMFVRTYVSGNKVGVQIYGKPDDKKYTYKRVTEIEEEIAPPADEIIIDEKGDYSNLVNYTDESAYITAAHKGYKVRAILEKYDGDNLVERKFLRRVSYNATKGVKVVGAKERPEPEPETPEIPADEVENINGNLSESTIEFWKKFTYY